MNMLIMSTLIKCTFGKTKHTGKFLFYLNMNRMLCLTSEAACFRIFRDSNAKM